jgi:hypothetical protein
MLLLELKVAMRFGHLPVRVAKIVDLGEAPQLHASVTCTKIETHSEMCMHSRRGHQGAET